jgi:MFS family permease
MRMHQSSRPQFSIRWLGIVALAALYGAFTFGWVIYRIHLPELLTQFKFSAEVAPKLLLIEAILAIGLEPLMGKISDRMAQRRGTRLPLIVLGVGLASAFFVAIPAWATFVSPDEVWRWGLPGLLIVWAIVMSMFRSPAIALLGQYASTTNLPLAASGLTFAAGIAGATAPLAKQFVLDLGAGVAFTAAAILLLATAAALRFFALAASEMLPSDTGDRYSLSRLCLIFVTGLAVTLAFRLAIETFPKILKTQLPQVNPALLIGAVFLALALAAVPTGIFAVRSGNRQAMLLGMLGAAGFLGLMTFTHSLFTGLIVAAGLGICFSLVINGTLPFALSLVPPRQAGLGIGVFFGGGAAATSLFIGFLSSGGLSSIAGICLSAVTLLAAGLYINASVEPA